jgi:hypothetical protein
MSHSPPLGSLRAAGKLKLNKPLTAKKASTQGALPDAARHAMIAEAAYYMAERRGFESGHELDDWLLAERQIDTVTAGADSPRD